MAYPDFPVEQPVTYRRYLLIKRHAWIDYGNSAMAGVWRSMQEALPGNALPTDFPFLSELAAAGYTAREDMDGATQDELVRIAHLHRSDAAYVLTAFAALPPLTP